MLHHGTMKQLRDQNWLEFIKNDSNPSQLKQRIRDSVAEMLAQLTVFAQKIPEDESESYLPRDRIIKVVVSLLKEAKLEDVTMNNVFKGEIDLKDLAKFDQNIPNSRKAFLASSLAELSLSSMIRQYKSLYPNTPHLSGIVTDQLEKTISMCKEIAYKIELIKQNEISIKNNSNYLFKWEEIPGKDEYRFLDFLESEFGQAYEKIEFVKRNYDKTLWFNTRVGLQDIDIVSGKIEIDVNWKKAEMTF